MAMALPVYAEVDLLPDAPDEVELLEDKPGTDSGEDTALPEQNAATPVPDAATPEPEQSAEPEQPAPPGTPAPPAAPTPAPAPPPPASDRHCTADAGADRDPHRHPGTDRTAAEDVRRKKRG